MGRRPRQAPLFRCSLLVGALLFSACEDPGAGRALRLLEFRQKDFDSVALNEELSFYFSAELDRTSVTSDSVRIQDELGREVAGERRVRGNVLSFLPELPCASDLTDGGLLPGTRYRVTLGGFPRPDGIRSSAGALLSASLLLSFRTAEPGDETPLFLDPFLGPFPLVPRGKPPKQIDNAIELEDGLLVLEYGEAIDPASVPGARFELSRFPPGARELAELEPIPVVARLIENRRDRARLLLDPTGLEGRLPPDTYYLRMPGRELRTLGGREVEPGRRLWTLVVPDARIEVEFGATGDSSSAPPGCDGTAIRNEKDPGLYVRYPAAAGNGNKGEVELRAAPAVADLHATRLTIPAGSDVDLGALAGPVVLRSQTSIDIVGRLVRRGAAQQDLHAEELERAAQLPSSARGPFSQWLARLIDPEPPRTREPWTVLVAGGDIRVPDGGAIDVEGPLLLVAGGSIRVAAKGKAFSHDILWKTLPGSGPYSQRRVLELPLPLDPPAINPLRTTLRVGALSAAFDWTPREGDWSVVFAGREGGGRLSAGFLQSAPGRDEWRRSDPSELAAGPVRVLVRLEVPPGRGEPWDPPQFERLKLEPVPGPMPAMSETFPKR